MSFKNLRKFFRRRYRNVFGTSITGTTAAQIRATREARGWSQQKLAEEVGMGQARISLLENPNYQNLSLNTLKRVANVFDVALIVRFVPFSKLFAMVDSESEETLTVPSFADEFGTEENPITTPSDKVIDLTERLKAYHLEGPREAVQGQEDMMCSVQRVSGAGAGTIRPNAPVPVSVSDPMDKYKPGALGESRNTSIVNRAAPLASNGGNR